MCFSAGASFAAGVVLIPAGCYCIATAVRKQPSAMTTAVVPLMFGVQQVAEGLVWHGLEHGDHRLAREASLVFLFFALAFWPFWFSFSAAVSDTRPHARWLFAGLALVSTAWFWLFFLPIASGPETLLSIRIVHHSIFYDFTTVPVAQSTPRNLMRVFYFLCVALPMLFGSSKLGRAYGLAFAILTAVAALVFHYAFLSVWCFMAAIMTVCLCWHFYTMKTEYREPAADIRTPVVN